MNQLKARQLISYRTSNIGWKGLPCNLDSLLRFQLSSWGLVSTASEAIHDYTFSGAAAAAAGGPGATPVGETWPAARGLTCHFLTVLKGLPCSYR